MFNFENKLTISILFNYLGNRNTNGEYVGHKPYELFHLLGYSGM
jgi:hypothetical protein